MPSGYTQWCLRKIIRRVEKHRFSEWKAGHQGPRDSGHWGHSALSQTGMEKSSGLPLTRLYDLVLFI